MLEFAGATNIIKSLRWDSSKKDCVLDLYGLANLGDVRAHKCEKGRGLNKFWENINKPQGFSLPDDIFRLRNKAIHFCLSVPIEIACFALEFTEKNLEDFKNN